jgi:anti-sigma factor RsiW
MSAHLGPAVTAFVDGELDHSRRDEVLAHLTHCDPCRTEVEGLRRFKSALRGTDGPAVPLDLAARLLAATEPELPVAAAAPRRLHGQRRSVRQHSRLRRTAFRGAILALGLGGTLGLAGPPPPGPLAPVDPSSLRFVIEHATTSGEVPFTELDVVSVSSSSSPR